MILEYNKQFVIHTKTTTYAFGAMETGQLEHYYYGKRIRFGEQLEGMEALKEQHAFAPGNSVTYDQKHLAYSLEDACLEVSAYGKGDIREPFVTVVHADGSKTSDFVYDSFAINEEKTPLQTLPYASGEEVQELCIILKDKQYDLTLELRYGVYEECDVITRSAILYNQGKTPVVLQRLLSGQLDFADSKYQLSTFHGAWAREMRKVDRDVTYGKYVGGSFTGTSSNRNNPFFMLAKPGTTQQSGKCYGFNLIYSGNHYEAVEVNAYGKTRVVFGINPEGFSWTLEAGQCFEAPEAVLSFSSDGYNGLSQNMHGFVRQHIIPKEWREKTRPILLNSWEAAYFNINEQKLLRLAKKAKEVGIELFVMDDGWFGERNDDSHSLGDWYENPKKLPHGLKGLGEKINALGLEFGIWVEPEMVNVESNLYRNHPDWCLAIPEKPHSEGRNQRMLDLGRSDVQDYLIEAMSKVFSSAKVSYVKWDMNRVVSDSYSGTLSPDRQGEAMHRYVMGLYHVMDELIRRFPEILFEGCASGGNRFDLGMLCYFPQIWGSDNTDAMSRAEIQTGYSYGYPLETVGAHVSGCPNHQTLRNTPLETRFGVAAFGSLGYECNLCDLPGEELEAIKEQIILYKHLRPWVQGSSFYRGRTFEDGNICEWTAVSQDQEKAVGVLVQKLVEPNSQYQYYRAKGLNPGWKYHFTNRKLKHNIKEFGDLVNTVSPIHVKQDSLLHNTLAKFIKMDGETEDAIVYGDLLMEAGVKLKQGFGGTGYNDQVRFFPDFASRMYFMEKVSM